MYSLTNFLKLKYLDKISVNLVNKIKKLRHSGIQNTEYKNTGASLCKASTNLGKERKSI